jgi:hypothetical protein
VKSYAVEKRERREGKRRKELLNDELRFGEF